MFNEYPYRNIEDLNLDYLQARVRNLEKIVEQFVALESVTFADPIQWNITTQYAKNTVVLDSEGDAFISIKPVPTGVYLNNGEYWLEIFNFMDYVKSFNANLTFNIEEDTNRATIAYSVGDWLLLDDVLYKVLVAIPADGLFEIGVNIEHFTVEDFIKAWINYANGLIVQYKNDIDASEVLYRNQLAGDIANTTASLQAQLDAAIAGATVDSEVILARVGWDSVTYATLGDAIRGQITDLHDILNIFQHNEFAGKYGVGGYTAYTLPCIINSSNQYESLANSDHILIPINAGDAVDLTANSSFAAIYAVLSYLDIPVNNGIPKFSTATGFTTRLTLASGQNVTFTAPADAVYLYITRKANNNNNFPAYVKINGINVLPSTEERLNSLNTKIDLRDAANLYAKKISFDRCAEHLYIGSDGKVSTPVNAAMAFIPVRENDVIYIQGNMSQQTWYALLTSKALERGQTAPFVVGGSRVSLTYGERVTITAPNDAMYLGVSIFDNYPNDIKPTHIYINGEPVYVDDMLYMLERQFTGFNIDDNLEDGIIANTTLWIQPQSKHVSIPVSGGELLQIVGNAELNTYYAFLTSDTVVYNSAASFCSGYSGRIEVATNTKSDIVTIPSDCNYLYISCVDGFGNDISPEKIIINGRDIRKTFGDYMTDVDDLVNDVYDVLPMFDNITCCGDSLTYSQVYVDNNSANARQAFVTYPQALEKLTGVTTHNYSHPGITALGWWANCSTGAFDAHGLYIIFLGTNMLLTDTIDTDCVGNDPDTFANTQTGQYGRILQTIVNQDDTFVLIRPYVGGGGDLDLTRSVIDKFGAKYNMPVIDISDKRLDRWLHRWPDNSGENTVHFDDLGYTWLANDIKNSINNLTMKEKWQISRKVQ